MKRSIGILGFGNMGSAIAERIKDIYAVFCFDRDKSRTAGISGIEVTEGALSLVDGVDVVILSVKPQDFKNLLNEIKVSRHLADKLFISIAAGITTDYIQEVFGVARVVRIMPNIAVKVGQGICCMAKGKYATTEDFDFAQDLFEYMGETLQIEEGRMNAATAVSGSGPGFFYHYLQEKGSLEIAADFTASLSEAAQKAGFTADAAELLSRATVNGSIAYLEKTKISALDAKKQITSNGGTTQAGLEVLEKGGSLSEAVNAAIKRAIELSQLL